MSWLAAGYGPVADIEIAWTLIALSGVVLSVRNVREALDDLRATSEISNGRRPIAVTAMRVEVARLLIQIVFTLIGVLVMSIHDPYPASTLTWQQAAVDIAARWGLIICSLLVLYQSIENRRLRRFLRGPAATEGDKA